jgi:hypothetical protein
MNAAKLVTILGGKGWKSPAQPLGGTLPSLWLLADDIAGSDGDAVSTWTSKEGNAYAFAQAGAATLKPTLKTGANGINAHNIIRFDGGDYLSNATMPLTDTAGTVVMVLNLASSPADFQDVLTISKSGATSYYVLLRPYYNSTTKTMSMAQRSADTADNTTGNTITGSGTNYVMLWQSSGTAWTARVNGTDQTLSVVTGGNSGDWFGDCAQKDNITIGGWQAATFTQPFKGDIAEILYYPRALTPAEIAKVETYLKTRYGITF